MLVISKKFHTEDVSEALVNLILNNQHICDIELLNEYPDMIVIVDIDSGRYIDTNQRVQKKCKKSNKELKEITIYDTANPNTHKEIDIFLKYAKKYKKVLPYEKHNIDSENHPFDFHVDGIVIRDNLLLWEAH